MAQDLQRVGCGGVQGPGGGRGRDRDGEAHRTRLLRSYIPDFTLLHQAQHGTEKRKKKRRRDDNLLDSSFRVGDFLSVRLAKAIDFNFIQLHKAQSAELNVFLDSQHKRKGRGR